jgi:selenide,water dikinase
VLQGAADVMENAGCVIVGGHSIDDPEPKFGLAITGTVNPGRLITNAAAEPGDLLVLTKALGTGIVSTAIKRGAADPILEATATASMTTLNAAARDAMVGAGVVAATDVTGFGLLGHLREMLEASGTGAEIRVDAVPVFDGVRELIAAGFVPGGTTRNLAYAAGFTDFGGSAEVDRVVLADAQTSGGLLVAAPAAAAGAIIDELGPPAAIIGEVDGDPGIRVR